MQSKAVSPDLTTSESVRVQVMPFVMRRTKDQVLKDLPPKIIQDVYVEPSALQRRLYEDFSASSASQQVASAVNADTTVESAASTAPHVFQVGDASCLVHANHLLKSMSL